ncbi:MAG TPA: PLDc N-terminal domain-containing protein [Candidatus Borkfalkia excrementavium]|uniref:PLDc N-terminal domain-containing protein n=1 Tax=Candidatus Borkfalkia excrementavium TaxID=2838505 RepID=A0A9D1Z7Q9_9FIRM|nr:PLDc N-terminal domain-containing protein [Candidatus Borkfalkia excrementavium]
MRKFLKILTGRFLFITILLLIEIVVVVGGSYLLTTRFLPAFYFYLLCIAGGLVLTVYIINSDINAEYKIAWLVPILVFPPFGVPIYLLLRRRKPRRKLKVLLRDYGRMSCLYKELPDISERFAESGDFDALCAEFVSEHGYLTPSDCFEYEYFSTGETFGAKLEDELAKAQKYIFLEYFVISEGKFWNRVFTILCDKAAKGVDVRVIYDDIGSMKGVPADFAAKLEKKGIKCLCFNRFRPVLDVGQNNRTHRKIAVIDGITAFTGGINIADEYTNEIELHGHWKDTGVMVRGRATQNFTAMFLQLWGLKSAGENYTQYLTECPPGKYLCLPFSDMPFENNTNICEDLYLRIIYNAKKYVYINTPYLIIDSEMKRALVTAAHSGVDVRITVPHIPDKKYVFAVTKAFYTQLLKEGIKIYSYTPGFIHAKSIVSDDRYALIGSSNMDFRSFYLHCECDIMFFEKEIADKLKEDYLNTCDECELVTEKKNKANIFTRMYRSILRIFAPLM